MKNIFQRQKLKFSTFHSNEFLRILAGLVENMRFIKCKYKSRTKTMTKSQQLLISNKIQQLVSLVLEKEP